MTATVATLWRYPVKSMLGEECAQVELTTRGVRGDRQLAIRSADGKFGSARTAGASATSRACSPSARALATNRPKSCFPMAAACAPTIRRSTPALGGTSSLAWLRARLPQSQVDERRFRPNITLATDQAELSWIGRTLQIGNTVKLRVTAPTGRCGMTTAAQTDLPFDPKILRCIAQEAGEDFGVYAEVLQPGTISRGDEVTVV